MIVLHFDLQPQFKYMIYFIYTSHQTGSELIRIFGYLLSVKIKATKPLPPFGNIRIKH